MRVLVTGATGLIGSSVCARLASDGHHVSAVLRPGGGPLPPSVSQVFHLDLARAETAADWLAPLAGIEAVVNCAGVLQDSPRENTRAVHTTAAAALFLACEQSGVRRVVQFSAIGIDRAQMSAFSASKHAGDAALRARDLDWVILRPSVVLGRPAFGASALFRGLAALPVLPLMPDTGALQVVQLEDVIDTVAFFLDPAAPARIEIELAGPERLAMAEVIALYREWLGWKPARRWLLPHRLGALLYRAGDAAGALGWRPPMRSTAAKEIVRGATGDPAPWTAITGVRPRSLSEALAGAPAGVQERWFARLYFLKPILFAVLAGFWIVTGLVSLTLGWGEGVELMRAVGAGQIAAPVVIAGALADVAIGAAIAYRPTARAGLWAAIALSVLYIIVASILVPWLWADPLGRLVKVAPILVLHLVGLAILEER